MGLISVKELLKDEILTIEVLDLEGEINTKGNYIYLSSLASTTALAANYEFTLVLAANSINGSSDSLEVLLEQVLKDIHEYVISNGKEIDIKVKIIKKNELFMYEIKLVLEDYVI